MLDRRSTLQAAALALALGAAACATGRGAFPPDDAVRPAPEAPTQLAEAHLPMPTLLQGAVAPSAPGSATGSMSVAPPPCRNLLVDPRDGTQLRLVRSRGSDRGDYRAPGGRYGLKAGELLRVDCRTDRTIGLVPER